MRVTFDVDLKNHIAWNLRLNTLNWCPTNIKSNVDPCKYLYGFEEGISCTNDHSSKTSSGHGIQREFTIESRGGIGADEPPSIAVKEAEIAFVSREFTAVTLADG